MNINYVDFIVYTRQQYIIRSRNAIRLVWIWGDAIWPAQYSSNLLNLHLFSSGQRPEISISIAHETASDF